MSEQQRRKDEERFNETLKRMLKTPPAARQVGKPVDRDKVPRPATKS